MSVETELGQTDDDDDGDATDLTAEAEADRPTDIVRLAGYTMEFLPGIMRRLFPPTPSARPPPIPGAWTHLEMWRWMNF